MIKILILLALSASLCHAATNFSVGLSSSSWKYSERLGIKYDGFFYGPHVSTSSDFLKYVDTQLNLSYRFGTARYDGHISNTNTPFSYDSKMTNITSSAKFFYSINQTRFKVIAGLSYNYIKDHDDDISQDYEREQTYLTLPIGLTWMLSHNDHHISFDFIYHVWLYGENETHLSDINSFNSDLSLIQDKGYGLEAGVTWRFDQISMKLDYLFWRVEDSETKNIIVAGLPITNTFREPQNKTNELKLAINWHF